VMEGSMVTVLIKDDKPQFEVKKKAPRQVHSILVESTHVAG
jgi:hypothetical protein